MPMKEQQRAVYRSARGKEVDLNKLIAKNELTLAVGNMHVNARGDKIGPGGKIIKPDQIQASGSVVPEQISVQEAVQDQLVEKAPAKKNVQNMDTEGNE